MSDIGTARRYAKAIFELAVEANAVEPMTNEVRAVGELLTSSPELSFVLDDPTVAPATRKAVLDDVLKSMGVAPLVRSAVLLVADHGRIRVLPQVAQVLAELADVRAGKVRAEVVSAAPLTEAQYTRLAASLEKLTNRKISLVRKVDPALIGGVVTRIGDLVYDGSVRARLAELRHALLPV